MGADIRHEGVVNSIDGQKVTVRILQTSACSGCQASRICRAAESKEKRVEVDYYGAESLSVGQTVTVAAGERMGITAVLLAFGLPLLLLLVALIVAMKATGSEKVAAIASLAVLVPYYVGLFLCRNKIKKDFKFRIIV
ncbi:MAG: SoxR reducing system RseC family protein [Bacteroidaceae bacterium]|nr:SoxR reducing system RseC family protein [Bacteroidaceae bacterium]